MSAHWIDITCRIFFFSNFLSTFLYDVRKNDIWPDSSLCDTESRHWWKYLCWKNIRAVVSWIVWLLFWWHRERKIKKKNKTMRECYWIEVRSRLFLFTITSYLIPNSVRIDVTLWLCVSLYLCIRRHFVNVEIFAHKTFIVIGIMFLIYQNVDNCGAGFDFVCHSILFYSILLFSFFFVFDSFLLRLTDFVLYIIF